MPKAAEALFQQLDSALKGPEGDEIQGKTKVSSPVQHAPAPRLAWEVYFQRVWDVV